MCCWENLVKSLKWCYILSCEVENRRVDNISFLYHIHTGYWVQQRWCKRGHEVRQCCVLIGWNDLRMRSGVRNEVNRGSRQQSPFVRPVSDDWWYPVFAIILLFCSSTRITNHSHKTCFGDGLSPVPANWSEVQRMSEMRPTFINVGYRLQFLGSHR